MQTMEQTNEYQWYALYTASRAEKKVKERFEKENVTHYLPLHEVTRVWSDRKKRVVVPVINGYIFVRITPDEMRKVKQIPGVVQFVRDKGAPAVIPESQMRNMQLMVDKSTEEVEFTLEDIQPGISVRITQGELEGLYGELVKIRGKYKVVVRLDKFGCAMTTIPVSAIEKV